MARADLIGNFIDVDFSGCRLGAATLCGDFERVRFTGADLSNVRFVNSRLSRVEFEGAALNQTSFINTELRSCNGLERVLHLGPSEFGFSTMVTSPEVPRLFWEAAGVAPSVVDAVFGARQSVQYYSCFISYAAEDSLFADELYEFLRSNGVGCWKADRSLLIGDPQRDAIFKAIKDHARFLVIISTHSVASGWVEQEVERALAIERDTGARRILPIQVDDAAMNSEMAWVVTLRDGRNVGNFTPWKSSSEREKLKRDLLLALKKSGRGV